MYKRVATCSEWRLPSDKLTPPSASPERALAHSETAGEEELTRKVMSHRLASQSDGVVKAVYDQVTRAAAYESAKQSRLDAKANVLLAATGITLTFFSAMVAASQLAHSRSWKLAILAFATVTGLVGVSTAVMALRATAVRRFEGLEEKHFFDADTLNYVATQGDKGATAYLVILVPQLAEAVNGLRKALEERAIKIGVAQKWFVAFLIGVALTLALIVAETLTRNA